MNAWQPGWVPQGWKRGQLLRVVPATPNREGAIWQSFTFDTDLSGVQQGNDIAVAAFRHDDGEKVRAWLDWWKVGEAETPT